MKNDIEIYVKIKNMATGKVKEIHCLVPERTQVVAGTRSRKGFSKEERLQKGVLNETKVAFVDPWNGIYSIESPIGKYLYNNLETIKVGDKFKTKNENGRPKEFEILNVKR